MFENLLVEKYRPKLLGDLVLSKKNRQYFEMVRVKKEIPHILFSGDRGIGKSTLAMIIVNELLDCQYLYINASNENGVDTIRSKITNFAQTLSLDGKLKVIILDECDFLTEQAQGALRHIIEKYAESTRFIATCNYVSMLIPPIRSRFLEFDLTPPHDMLSERIIHIIKSEKITVSAEQLPILGKVIKTNYPDMRKMIGEIQKSSFTGALDLDDRQDNTKIASRLFEMMTNKTSEVKLREFIVASEIEFGCDYHRLLKNMFEVVFKADIIVDKRAPLMLVIANKLVEHQTVLDKEINFFACVLEMLEVIK
jgi:DNA polymerase III delta prime subunit